MDKLLNTLHNKLKSLRDREQERRDNYRSMYGGGSTEAERADERASIYDALADMILEILIEMNHI